MKRNVCTPDAPRSDAASSSERDTRRSRARTLLKTTTMQNVVWPTMTVRIDRSTLANRKNDAKATPVIAPGRMIGSVTTKLTVDSPKNLKRAKANAIPVPSTRAKKVENSAICTDSHAAFLGAESCASVVNQRVEKPGNGHELMLVLLNA